MCFSPLKVALKVTGPKPETTTVLIQGFKRTGIGGQALWEARKGKLACVMSGGWLLDALSKTRLQPLCENIPNHKPLRCT